MNDFSAEWLDKLIEYASSIQADSFPKPYSLTMIARRITLPAKTFNRRISRDPDLFIVGASISNSSVQRKT
jgi:hypothetical protein